MPPATTGPAAPIEPPLAATPFTVSKFLAVLNSQSTVPSSVDNARKTPSQPPEKTAPGVAVRGPSCPGCVAAAAAGDSGLNHFFSPLLIRTAAIPLGPNPK